MAVQFKFRSSAKFDSVDLEGRASIRVRDLKAKIIRHNNLNICQDSDLVFSDSITGQEYTNENIQIPCGSSVIIKRVPAGSVHVDMPHFNCKEAGNPPNVETVDFDDFGVDVYPVPEATFVCSGLDADKDACSLGYEPNTGITRCLEPAVGGCQKLEASGISDAIPGSHSHGGVEQILPQTKSRPEVQEDFNLKKMGCDPVDTKHADMPSEMKCSLCNSFFKEAVMIPCCQHSFCEKCIRQMLLEKARCPKCFSTKSRIEDLLPNISLRQAMEHFQESQNLITVPDNAFCQYAPDGESGIQAKDVSCGGSIFQRESELPHSPETGMGSNNCLAESACHSPFKNDAPYHFGARNMQKFPKFSHKNNQIEGDGYGSTRVAPYGLAAFDDFQGESKPIPEEAEPVIKKKRPPWVYTAGGGKSFMESGRNRKGDRACYMCGSPDHLIRVCPVATSPRPMLHSGNAVFPGAMPGYVPPYWDGALLPHTPPFRNLYGNHGMTALDTMLIPHAPFSVHPYMHTPSMYRSIPGFGGYMGMGGVAPLPETGEDCYISRSEFLDLEGQEKRSKLSKENFRRDQSCDDDEDWGRHQYNGSARLQEHKSFVNREKSVSYSSDGSTKRSQRQDRHRNQIDDNNIHLVGLQKSSHLVVGHQDGKLYNRTEKSSSELDDMPSSSSWHSEEKHKHYHRSSRKQNERREQCDCDKHKHYHRSSRYQKERREQCGSDSSRSHHQNIIEKDDKRKGIRHNNKRHKHHSNSGSGLEHSVSSDKKLQKGSSHNFRKSEHNAKSSVDERSHDRWKMVSGSDEDSGENYRYCKQKRVK
ncbi:putative transcription factor interactor and regulator CCHC(Zn) family [Rosa chinensis]|uniref:Putative transcription factor interactor and regulator CCHC(Zn) family n=1 Tax=Rosa chinensis TaxID=74649 RepID=A0A2P6Q1F7_ROSCH|nr:E3 ubiquitin ligase PARAQUAT TOLERANCE 3 isoform X1 [Rosa chinensis]XP_040363553.1 E3 ubiquitin ligase PARAQUAT TOLERANCE 3 isoform X1 [Rosa chinensis]XP_040363554.1 E3 ubiquitin ligase PARAQUAT TOLERANCE 3 isoform X1 [Rosa chinensis]PRQ28030.1 putative transcription factor interactor and regulator CCHC(Zn) family [Rosa chinensis]